MTVKWQKSILLAKIKKSEESGPSYFLILHEIVSPNIFWGPPWLRK